MGTAFQETEACVFLWKTFRETPLSHWRLLFFVVMWKLLDCWLQANGQWFLRLHWCTTSTLYSCQLRGGSRLQSTTNELRQIIWPISQPFQQRHAMETQDLLNHCCCKWTKTGFCRVSLKPWFYVASTCKMAMEHILSFHLYNFFEVLKVHFWDTKTQKSLQ